MPEYMRIMYIMLNRIYMSLSSWDPNTLSTKAFDKEDK
jgi:hypothetical protein